MKSVNCIGLSLDDRVLFFTTATTATKALLSRTKTMTEERTLQCPLLDYP
jgi:hypothetical protein